MAKMPRYNHNFLNTTRHKMKGIEARKNQKKKKAEQKEKRKKDN